MVNFLTRALAMVGLGANEAPNLAADPFSWQFWSDGAVLGGDDAGQRVDGDSVLQLGVVAAVLERLGGTLSELPMMVFERTSGTERRPATDHPLYDLLHRRPAPGLTSALWRDEQTRHLALWRNCYHRILSDPETGYPVGSLEMIHPGRLERIQSIGGRVYYTFRRLAPQTGTDTYRDDEIWHIKRAPLTMDGLMGRPVWETSRKVFAYAQAVHQFGALYFKNSGTGGGVIKHPGQFKSAADRDAFLDGWRSGGVGLNRHKDRLLQFGLDYVPFNVRNDEAQFNESKVGAAQDVCRVFNMPPHMAGILDNATFSNIEQQSIEFVIYTIGPIVSAIEQSASAELLIGEDRDRYFIEINVSGLLRGDIKTRWTAFAQGRQWGWLSVNDVRQLENMDPIGPGGDLYLTPMNMSPTGQPAGDGETTGPGDNDRQDPADNPNDPDAG